MEMRLDNAHTIVIYPEQLHQLDAWADPAAYIEKSGLFQVTEEFEERILPLLETTRFAMVHCAAFDIDPETCGLADDWQRLRSLAGRGSFMHPVLPLMIFEAIEEKSLVDPCLLLRNRGPHPDKINSFFVQHGLEVFRIDLEHDGEQEVEWWISASGLGDDQTYSGGQRVFLCT